MIHIVRRHKADGSDADMPRRYLFTIGKGYCVENTSGEEIVSVIKEQPGDIKIIKRRFSGFHDTALDATLRVLGVRRVYVTGTQYPNCIRATAVDAMSLDYDTIVVTDCCSAATPEIACSNIRDMQAMGIRCENSQDIKSQYQ